MFSTGGLVGLLTLRAFVATQLGYKVLWNISIKEPRNTGFRERMISYFFSLSMKVTFFAAVDRNFPISFFPRDTFIYQTSSFHRRLWRTANAPVKVNLNPPHPETCGALVGLYHHIGSSLSPQYVEDSRVFLLLSCGMWGISRGFVLI